MNTTTILSTIDAEISKLQQARALLTGDSSKPAAAPENRGPGPKKIVAAPAKKSARPQAKRVMSEEARARISAAVKKRWAAAKKVAK